MAGCRFNLTVRVSSLNPQAVRRVLIEMIPRGSLEADGEDFVVQAEASGASAKELNRELLSALRRAEKRTRIRSEWTADDGTTYRFFDYVLKNTSKR